MVSVEMIRKLRRHVVGCMFLKDYLLSLVRSSAGATPCWVSSSQLIWDS